MNKLFSFLLVPVLLFGFVACTFFDTGFEVSEFTISLDDGSIPPQYYSESSIKLVPDYELRVLAVEYSVKYPYRTDETIENDFSAEGVIGGENFDKFIEVIDVMDNTSWSSIDASCVGGHNMNIDYVRFKTVPSNGEKSGENMRYEGHMDFYFCGDQFEDALFIKDFGLDVADLLSEDIY